MTVRDELNTSARLKGFGPGVTDTVKDAVKDYVMDQVEKLVWAKFDEYAKAGKLKVRVLFFSVDVAHILEGFLVQVIGPRPTPSLA